MVMTTSHKHVNRSLTNSAGRTIEKCRVVVSLLAEIEAAEAIIILTCAEKPETYTGKLQVNLKTPFEDSSIQLLECAISPGLYNASALFLGRRLKFQLNVINVQGRCDLPSQIEICELRSQKRRKFGPEVEVAEISTKTGVIMATPVDLSQESIALIVNSGKASISRGDSVFLVIRGDTLHRDVFTGYVSVMDNRVVQGITRLLLKPDTQKNKEKNQLRIRRSPRAKQPSMSMVIGPIDDHLGETVSSKVIDISLVGCQCRIEHVDRMAWIVAGMSIQLSKEDLTATIIWKEQDRIGIRVDGLDDSATLFRWAQFIRQQGIGHNLHHSQMEELVHLFTETGFLKGNRRKIYGADPSKFLPPDRMADNPLLLHRVHALSENGGISSHIGICRLSDDAWIFHEGAHAGGDGPSYQQLYEKVLIYTQNLYLSSRQSPRYLSGMYHASVKTPEILGQRLYKTGFCSVFPLYHVSMSTNIESNERSDNKLENSVDIIDIANMTAASRRESLIGFNPTLCEAFVGQLGEHPRLNAELAKVGSYHNARTVMLRSHQNVWGIAHRIRSYFSLNATGIINSLFIIVKPDVLVGDLISAFSLLVEDGLAFGTDDAAIIVDGSRDQDYLFSLDLKDSKKFTFFILDCLLNTEFLDATVENILSPEISRRRENS